MLGDLLRAIVFDFCRQRGGARASDIYFSRVSITIYVLRNPFHVCICHQPDDNVLINSINIPIVQVRRQAQTEVTCSRSAET